MTANLTRIPGYVWLAISLFAVCSISLWLRYSALELVYDHPDEPIATALVNGIAKNKTLDTNWINYEVPERFKKRFPDGQYNFSSYYLPFGLLNQLTAERFDFDLRALRTASMAMSVAVILATFALGWRLGGNLVGFSAALMVAASSQIFHDSLYARPEAFFTLLTVLAMYAAAAAQAHSYRLLALSSVIMGILIACKISAMPLVPIPGLIFLLMQDRLTFRRVFNVGFISLSGVFAGALIGAPHAFLNPDAFFAGAAGLVHQYSTGGGPLGLKDGGYLERCVYLLNYLGPTMGWPVIVLAGVGFFVARTNAIMMVIAFAALASLIYLGTKTVFFERNFSHCLPVVYILSGFGVKAVSGFFGRAKLLIIGSILVLAMWPGIALTKIIRFDILTGKDNERIQQFRQNIQNSYPQRLPYVIWPNLTYGDAYPALQAHLAKQQCPCLVEFFDSDDRYSWNTLNRFQHEYKARYIAKIDSPFRNISTSTLQQYLAVSHVVFYVEATAGK
jgi:4-amino-4-deoxy-L-arabinose transferase-like glycosyltransferase